MGGSLGRGAGDQWSDIDAGVVEAMHSAARKAAESIGYVGAGTVEFLYDPQYERFFFKPDWAQPESDAQE